MIKLFEILKKQLIFILKKIDRYFSELHVSSKFLFIITFISLIIISISIFIPNLDTTNNLSTIRTLFSSLIGWLLEKSTKFICNNKFSKIKNYCVGSISLITLLVLLLAITNNINDNHSLILLKNTLFSSIGFLISSSQSCDKT